MTLSKIGFWVSLVLVSTGASVFAADDSVQQLLRATSDAFEGTVDIQVLVDTDTVATGLQYVSSDGKTGSFGLGDLSQGIVLMKHMGKEVAILQSPDFDPAHGGTFKIVYIHNAINNTYRTIVMDLVRTGDVWQLKATDQSGHPVVTRGYFKSKKFLGQIVGIDKIVLN